MAVVQAMTESAQKKIQKARAQMSKTRQDQRKVEKKKLPMIDPMAAAKEKQN